MAQKQLDVLAVGDVVIDAFIKLLDDEAKVEKDNDEARLILPFGTKIPFDFSEIIPAVGNAANATVAFAKLGFESGFVSNVGSDDLGRDILKTLHKAGVDTRFVHINPGRKSNYHFVLWYKDDRTILVKHEDYDYHWPRFRIIDLPKWVYFSSVSPSANEYHDEVLSWLQAHPSIKLAFQPGVFEMKMGVQKLKRFYERAMIVLVNREEASTISGGDHNDIHDLLDRVHELGPRIVMISDGPAGAYASDGQSRFKMPIYPDPKPPYDRTGAGDAFSSTFVAAIMKGASVEAALLWAPINAMSVVQKIGAQAGLLSQSEIEQYLRVAPPWYHPQRLR